MCIKVLDKFNISKYYFSSLLYKLSPLTKIICMLLFILMVTFSNDFIALMILTILVGLMVLISMVPMKIYYLITKKFIYLILGLSIISMALTFSLVFGLLFFIKMILILIMFELFMMTSLTEIIYGLNELLKPLEKHKIKTSKITFKIVMGLNKILDLLYNLEKVFKFKFNHLNIKYNTKAVISYNKNKHIAIMKKMKANGFDVDHSRTYRHLNNWDKLDTYITVAYSVIFIIIVVEGALL